MLLLISIVCAYVGSWEVLALALCIHGRAQHVVRAKQGPEQQRALPPGTCACACACKSRLQPPLHVPTAVSQRPATKHNCECAAAVLVPAMHLQPLAVPVQPSAMVSHHHLTRACRFTEAIGVLNAHLQALASTRARTRFVDCSSDFLAPVRAVLCCPLVDRTENLSSTQHCAAVCMAAVPTTSIATACQCAACMAPSRIRLSSLCCR
jgi:hypothetical protein